MKRTRRVGAEDSETRTAVLDATENLMLEEGYAAVSTRRVAKQLGLTPALIHYYFPTTDDLLVAAYRRASDRTVERLQQVLQCDNPLRALWTFSMDATCTSLAMEFLAMANHRKVIRAELASSTKSYRVMQAAALSQLSVGKDWPNLHPLGIIVLIAGISRLFVLEKTHGISTGHAEAVAIVEHCIAQLTRANRRTSPSARRRGQKRATKRVPR